MITIQAQVIPNFQYGSTAPTLYYCAQDDFVSSEGQIIIRGNYEEDNSWWKKVECTVAGTDLTIPEHTLETTTDSDNPNARWKAYLVQNNQILPFLVADFALPATENNEITWAEIRTFNRALRPLGQNEFLTKEQQFRTFLRREDLTEQIEEAVDNAIGNELDAKQDTLISGENLKTVNGQSLLGAGDIEIEGGEGGGEWGDIEGTISAQTDLQNALNAKQNSLVSGANIKTVNGNSIVGSGDIAITPASIGAVTPSDVESSINSLIDAAPGALDTLNELANALGDDPNFATTVTNNIAGKLAIASNLSEVANKETALNNLLPVQTNQKYKNLTTDGSTHFYKQPKGFHWFNADAGLRNYLIALANAKNEPVNIVLYQDSGGSGAFADDLYGYCQRLCAELQRRFGKGTERSHFHSVALNLENDTFVKTVGAWENLNQGGIAGRSFGETGNTKKLTVSGLIGDCIEVYYVRNTNTNGTWSYKIDDETSVDVPQTVTASLATAVVERLEIPVTPGLPHSLEITAPSAGYVYITAVASRIGENGIRFYNWWMGGAATSHFASTTDNRHKALQASEPHLVIIPFSLNDEGFQTTISDYKANLRLMIDAAQEVNSSVLLISEWYSTYSDGQTIKFNQYVQAMREIALEKNVALCELSALMPTFAEMDALGLLHEDGVHPTTAGHAWIADVLAAELIKEVPAERGDRQPLYPIFAPTTLDVNKSGSTVFITPGGEATLPIGESEVWFNFLAQTGVTGILHIPDGLIVVGADGDIIFGGDEVSIEFEGSQAFQLYCVNKGIWFQRFPQGYSEGGGVDEEAVLELIAENAPNENNPIFDENGNELLEFGKVASAVNNVEIKNAATGNFPEIRPKGESNIGLNFDVDGNANINLTTPNGYGLQFLSTAYGETYKGRIGGDVGNLVIRYWGNQAIYFDSGSSYFDLTGSLYCRWTISSAFKKTANSLAQITSDQTDYLAGSAYPNEGKPVLRIDSDANRVIKSLYHGGANWAGQELIFINVGSFNITFNHNDTSGTTAAYRFISTTGSNVVLAPNEMLYLWYDSADSRWRIHKK